MQNITNKETREDLPNDWLPDGTDTENFLKKDKEWTDLENRLGQPRILKNIYLPEILNWTKNEFQNHPDDFSFFEAGCGHGNDLRAMRKELGQRGRFLGVDISAAEILHGLEYYQQQEQENTDESRGLFAQQNLLDLGVVNGWNEEKKDFSKPIEIKDGEFDLVYMEAVLHGMGFGEKTWHGKKEAAQKFLNELYRICKKGGKFFGRANTFDANIDLGQQLQQMRAANDWRFIPNADDFTEMLGKAGFINIKKTLASEEKAFPDPKRKDVIRFSFLAEK